MGEWRDIETAPKDGTFVLVICDGAWCPSISRWNGGRSHPDGTPFDEGWGDELGTFHIPGLNMPTHWMPLPEPPTSSV